MADTKIQIIINAQDKASGVLGNVGSVLGGIGAAATAAAATFGAAAISMGAYMVKLAADAAPLQGIQGAFEGITESSGQSATAMLAALEESSAGMISQRDLMTSYNKAAQLVGDSFANQLPEAMQYLSKVAAATGEDMDFMLNSLVVGVGRVSPMILDNLGIQVQVSEATERAAEMFGKEAEELSKAEQQAGLMSVVLEKLEANTANMPEVAGSAAASFAQIGTQMQNLKDQIGLALLPVVQPFVDSLGQLAQEYGPVLIEIFQQFATQMGEVLPPTMALLTEALTRIAVLFGSTGEEVTGMDVILAAFKITLDMIVTAIQLAAIAFNQIAYEAEMLDSWIKAVKGGVAAFQAQLTEMLEPVQQAVEWLGQLGNLFSAINVPDIGGFVNQLKDLAHIELPNIQLPQIGGGKGILGFQEGGVVPGPMGAPKLAVVHGGETVTPPGGAAVGGGTQVIQLVVDGRVLAEVVNGHLGAMARQSARMGGAAAL